MNDQTLFAVLFALAVVVCVGVAIAAQEFRRAGAAQAAAVDTPSSLELEHMELHRDLGAATQVSGRTGQAAQRLATLLHGHFESEEEFAMPPLALLGRLAQGRVSPWMREVLTMTDRLETELPRMLDEHKAIVAALDELERAAQAKGHPEVVRFVEKLELHAQMEEEIFYPAAILAGKYLKLQGR
jgi:hypothetical protein